MTAKERLVAIGLLAGGLGCAGIGVLQAQETADFVVTGLFLLAFGTAMQMGVPVLRHLSSVALLPMRLSRKKHPTA